MSLAMFNGLMLLWNELRGKENCCISVQWESFGDSTKWNLFT